MAQAILPQAVLVQAFFELHRGVAVRQLKVSQHVDGGTADAGHNRAYLKHQGKWFLCEDDRFPVERVPKDTDFEQTYSILLKRVEDMSQQNVGAQESRVINESSSIL